MSHNSSTFGKDWKAAKALKQGKSPKVGSLAVHRNKSNETNKNIQTSINHLMERNTMLFGPAGHNFYNPMANKKQLGGDSGAPHNGQPTASQFFNFGPVPQGPVGFYMHGGINLPEAFPQQPTANVFFSGAPWASHLGSMAYGGAPCFECGGAHMEMGGMTQFGGVNDGSMDNFKEGGHWIQKATKNMRKDHPCTGSKFGGPDCPPGSKRYNLAKTFRAMAKKAYGGTSDGADQDDVIAQRANQFNNLVRMNYGMAEAENQMNKLNAMAQDASILGMPTAAYGYNMGYDPAMQQAAANYGQAQGMLDQMNNAGKQATAGFFNAFNTGLQNAYAPGNQYIKWKMTPTKQMGGDLPKAAFGYDSYGRPANNQMGPLSWDETNQRTIDSMPWNYQFGPTPAGGWYRGVPGVTDMLYRSPQYSQRNPDQTYWTSQNGQTRYDYGNPDSWYNVYQHPQGGGNWNTQGWNSPNPFYNQMFGNPNFHTALSDFEVKRGWFGSMNNPKKVKMHFNTYINPQTGKVEVATTPQGPTAGPVQGTQNKPAPADYNFMADTNKQLPGPRAEQTPDVVKSDRQKQIEQFMSTMHTPNGTNNYSPSPVPNPTNTAIQTVKDNRLKPDPNSNYNFMDDVMQNQSQAGPRTGMAYGGYIPVAAFGYNMYGQPDPNLMGPLSPEYEAQLAQQAPQAQQAGTPSGGYDLTGKRKNPWSGQDIFGVTMGILGMGTNLALGDEKRKMEEYMAKQSLANNMFSAANSYRGDITQTGAGYGDQFGHQNQTPPGGYTKNGGYVYAKGGAYQTGVPVELTDEEIEELRKAGHKIDFV